MGRRIFRRKAEKNSELKQQKLVHKPKGQPQKQGNKEVARVQTASNTSKLPLI